MGNPSTIAIVGGGIIGTTIAWRLAQRGTGVTLFEKGQVGGEASWAAAGMLAPGGEIDEDTSAEQAALFLESRRKYSAFVAELSEESGVPIDYRECGALDLAYSPEEWSGLRTRAANQAGRGISSRELTPDQVGTFSPHIETDRLTGALFYPEDGIVAPRDLMSALKGACLARGITLWERSPVDEIEVHDDSVSLMGRRFAAAVVAGGAWSSSISVKGVPTLPRCEPVKGHLLGFDLQLGACPTIVRHRHIYVFQRGTGFVVAGSSTEHVGFERAINSAVSEQLFRQVTRVLPVLGKVQALDVWTGFRPSADRLHIEAWHSNNLFLAYGHYRNGILLAPATADRLVETILLSAPLPGFIRSGAPH